MRRAIRNGFPWLLWEDLEGYLREGEFIVLSTEVGVEGFYVYANDADGRRIADALRPNSQAALYALRDELQIVRR